MGLLQTHTHVTGSCTSAGTNIIHTQTKLKSDAAPPATQAVCARKLVLSGDLGRGRLVLSLGRPKPPTLVHVCSPWGQEAGRRLGARETVLVCAQHRQSSLSPELPSLGHLLWTRGRPLGLVDAHADSSAAGGWPSETRPAGSWQGLPALSAWDFPPPELGSDRGHSLSRLSPPGPDAGAADQLPRASPRA